MDRLDLSGIGGWIRLCHAGKGVETSVDAFVANNEAEEIVVSSLRCIVLRLVDLYRGFIHVLRIQTALTELCFSATGSGSRLCNM
jgi:hypothetical protein